MMDRSRIWEALFALSDMHGHAGAEMRALSAIDIALWDLAGRHTGPCLRTPGRSHARSGRDL
jgi:L-alanine-DL-glutamate epimerase-like enolase superfamily enzyme